jgi:ketosteroid isomerase-like protein
VKALTPAIALGAFLAGPAFGEDAVSAVQNLGQKWVKAYDARDAAALTALYTKNAVLLPGRQPSTEWRGRHSQVLRGCGQTAGQ